MIRVLTMIAVAGFLVSAVTLSVAVGLAGPENIAHGYWGFGPDGGGLHWHGHNHFSWSRSDDGRSDEDGPQTTRDIAWSGGDALTIDVPADVHYTQAAGPAKVTASGPNNAVADLRMDGGRLYYAEDRDHDARLVLTISAPSVTDFTLESSGALDLSNYRQDKLVLAVEGDGDVKGAGAAKAIQLTISGSGNADLGALKAQSAKVEIDGSGDARLAPAEAADIDISGSGEVTLLSHPPKLSTRISGSGHVRHEDGSSEGGSNGD